MVPKRPQAQVKLAAQECVLILVDLSIVRGVDHVEEAVDDIPDGRVEAQAFALQQRELRVQPLVVILTSVRREVPHVVELPELVEHCARNAVDLIGGESARTTPPPRV